MKYYIEINNDFDKQIKSTFRYNDSPAVNIAPLINDENFMKGYVFALTTHFGESLMPDNVLLSAYIEDDDADIVLALCQIDTLFFWIIEENISSSYGGTFMLPKYYSTMREAIENQPLYTESLEAFIRISGL